MTHPAISLAPYQSLWEIMNAEKAQLKTIWRNWHKEKSKRHLKKGSAPGLVISEAHSSRLALQYIPS